LDLYASHGFFLKAFPDVHDATEYMVHDIQFNVIYFNCAFTKLIVPKEGNITLSTMTDHKSFIKAWLSHYCSPSDVLLDFTVISKSVGFSVIQVYLSECCPTFLSFIPKISDALSPVEVMLLEDP
jgi:hypothetical protein